MKLTMFAMAFGLALLWTLPDVVDAQGFGGLTGVAQHRFEPTLLTVTEGPHTVEIAAAGFHPYVDRFVADRTGVSQFVVTLAPQ